MLTRKHSLSDLGTEVLVRILRHIPVEQCRKELPLVSKYWRRLLREPEVWHGRLSFTFSGMKVHSLLFISPDSRSCLFVFVQQPEVLGRFPQANHLGRSIAWILKRTHEDGTAGICLALKLLSEQTAIQEFSFLLTVSCWVQACSVG